MPLGGKDFYAAYGHPKKNESKFMVVWDVPAHLEMGVIPKRVYINKDAIPFLEQAFQNLVDRGFWKELETWDGCHNYRPVRGHESSYRRLISQGNEQRAIRLLSIHSWGGAIDVNAATNGLGKKPQLSPGFVKCFTDAGWDWGGNFKRQDGMHFQLKVIPRTTR